MNIKVGKFQISNSDSQYIVSEPRVSKKDKVYLANQTYHPTIESALESVVKRKISESNATTLEQLRRDIHDAVTWLKEQFQPVAPINIGRYSFDAAWDEAHSGDVVAA